MLQESQIIQKIALREEICRPKIPRRVLVFWSEEKLLPMTCPLGPSKHPRYRRSIADRFVDLKGDAHVKSQGKVGFLKFFSGIFLGCITAML